MSDKKPIESSNHKLPLVIHHKFDSFEIQISEQKKLDSFAQMFLKLPKKCKQIVKLWLLDMSKILI